MLENEGGHDGDENDESVLEVPIIDEVHKEVVNNVCFLDGFNLKASLLTSSAIFQKIYFRHNTWILHKLATCC